MPPAGVSQKLCRLTDFGWYSKGRHRETPPFVGMSKFDRTQTEALQTLFYDPTPFTRLSIRSPSPSPASGSCRRRPPSREAWHRPETVEGAFWHVGLKGDHQEGHPWGGPSMNCTGSQTASSYERLSTSQVVGIMDTPSCPSIASWLVHEKEDG